jgi:hypothetical protein
VHLKIQLVHPGEKFENSNIFKIQKEHIKGLAFSEVFDMPLIQSFSRRCWSDEVLQLEISKKRAWAARLL